MKSLSLLKSLNKSIIIILLLIINSSCEKCDKNKHYETQVTSERWDNGPGGFPDTNNFKVYLYRTEGEYLSDQNRITPKFNGYAYQISDNAKTYYWVRINQDSLNNLRYNQICTDPSKCGNMNGGYGRPNDCDEYFYTRLTAELSTTPTKLQLNIKNNGNAVSGAIVQLFYTKDDFDKDIIPTYSSTWLKYTQRNYNFEYGSSFIDTTKNDGIAYFSNLEPREYLFKVTKGKLSNSSTTIKTLKPLPDDPNVTTVLDVGIK